MRFSLKDPASDTRSPCLLIKKKFYDRILSGDKRIEYREATPRYDRIFSSLPGAVTLLCGRESRRFKVVGLRRCWGQWMIYLGDEL
jgi:hypothetical protein